MFIHDRFFMAEVRLRIDDELVEHPGDGLAVVHFQPARVEVVDQAEQFLVLGVDEIIANQVLV